MAGKRLILIVSCIIISVLVSGQDIKLSTIPGGVYGSGAGITVPISLSGCFSLDNEFQLYLSDASGNFTNGKKIGTYYGFFTPFVNGIIPTGTAAGTNYKIKVVSTSPSISKEFGPISISSSASAPVANPTSTASNTIYDSTFGRCLITTDQSIVLQETIPAGKTMSAQVFDSTGSPITATVSSNQVQFTMVPGNYYTVSIQLKTTSDNTISTKSFLVLASSNNLSLQTSGANDVCLPAFKSYTVNVTGNGGIKFNYPGCKYSIDWGDGTIDTYTHCEMVNRNGQLLHTYKTTSCGRPPITELSPIQYNAFRVGVSANNPFCSSAFTALTTYAKAWEQPIADFEAVTGCLNSPVTFINTSKAGTAAANNAINCTDNAVYEWWVDGKLVFNAPKDLVYTFTTLGTHTVRLVAVNEPCSDEITKQIEIQDGYNFGYTVNGSDSLKACVPLVVNINNTTTPPAGVNISDTKWSWYILKRNSITYAVKGEDFIFLSGDSTSANPSIKFIKPGNYRIRLTVKDYSCAGYKEVKVTVTDSASLTVPTTSKRYCDLQTIDFATDPNHQLTYSSNTGSETYSWTITGGSYSFEDGTNSNSPYPKIKFKDYSTYTATVVFNNGCGTNTTPFELSFDRPITATGSNDTTLCTSVSTLQVTGTATGPYKSFGWIVVKGTGTLSDANVSNPVYTFGSADTASVVLRFTVYPVSSSICSPVNDDITITLNPYNKITSSDSTLICSGTSVNYTPTSAISNTTYSWTSTITSGTVTGNSASGTGTINDVLSNTSKTADAVLKYTIVPIKGTCSGETFSLIVVVAPQPDLNVTVASDSLCNGTTTNINLSSSFSKALFTWTAAPSSGNITGFSNKNVPDTFNVISQTLINTGTQIEKVTYTIKGFSGNGQCGEQTKVVTITVKPGLTVANAGFDQILCNQAEVTLVGNNPSVGTSSWQQVAGPSTPIVNSGSYQATALGLQPNQTYKYLYSISGIGSCPPTTDTVVIANRPKPTANAGADTVVCAFNGLKDSINLAAKLSNTFDAGVWHILLPKPTGSNPVIKDSSKANSIFIFDKSGVYKLVWTTTNDAGCSSSSDTMLVNVFKKPVADSLTLSTASVCKGGNVTVTAGNNTGTIKKWQYNPAPFHDNVWIDSVSSANFLNFNAVKDSIKVRVIVETSTTCFNYDTSKEVTIHVNPLSVGGKTLQSDSVCSSNNNGVISLSGHVGSIKYWESSTNSGNTWSKISDTTTSITYNNIPTTTWYRAIVQVGLCTPANSDTTIITVLNKVTQAVVGSDQVLCNNTASLEANAPITGETGKWLQLTGPNTATLSSTSNAFITASDLVAGTYKFVWELSNAGCLPTRDTVTVSVRPVVTKANAGNDLIVCDIGLNNSINLHANSDASRPFEKGEWSIISQPQEGSATFSNLADPNALFNFKSVGVYKLVWKLTNDASCSTTYDTVDVKVYQRPVSGFIKGNTELCVGSDVTITMGNSTGIVQKWQYNPAPFNDDIWRDTIVTSSTINFVSIPDSFAIRAIVQSAGFADGCSFTDTSNVLIINAIPGSVPGTSGPNDTVCTSLNNGVVSLSGNVGEIIRWEYSDNNGANWNIINNATSSITYKNLLKTTWFKAVVQSGLCGNVSSSKTIITVLDTVAKVNAGSDQVVCTGQPVTLTGSNPTSVEQVSWSQISGSTATLSAANVPSLTVSDLKAGIYRFVYTVSNGYCAPKSDTVEVKVESSLVNIIDTTSRDICFGQSITITGEVPTGGNGNYSYQWQQSTDSTTWVDIADQTKQSLTFIPPSSIYVRRVTTSLPCSDISLKAFIYVQGPITHNSIIGNNQNICINTVADTLNGSVPNGFNSPYNYQWQKSIDSGKTWVDILNATEKDYAPGVLSVSTQYRRMVSAMLCTGPQSSISNVVDILINPNAIADFVVVKDRSCPAFIIDTTVIKNVPSVGNGAYNWFANGNFIGSGEHFPGYVINTSGDSVIIKLVVTGVHGCNIDSTSHVFYTKLKPEPAFNISTNEGCGPLLVAFTNTTPNLASFSYKWNFGTGQISSAANPGDIVFPANPNYGDTVYTVSLTVYSECDSFVVTKDILVHSKVKAVFSPDNTMSCSPFPVTFINNSVGAYDFTWNFGDGTVVNTTTTQSMKHTYVTNVRDTFMVSLIARSTCGNDTQRYSIIVSPNNITLFVTVNGTEKFGCSPHAVNFINNSTGATSYKWDFGDGNVMTTTNSNQSVVHMFNKPGIYNVKIVGSNNCSDTTGYVTVTVLPKPNVDFLAPASGCIGDSVRFSNLSDSITSSHWNFGDGTVSTLTNPIHKYANPGVYTVVLKGMRHFASGNVCMDSVVKTVTIVPSIAGAFLMDDTTSKCAPFVVTFKNLSVPASNTAWDFGDGTKATGDVVKHTFVTNGVFNVQMIATNAEGCKYTADKDIIVDNPGGSITYDGGLKCNNTSVKFTANTINVGSVRWNFGDGKTLTTTEKVVYHTYTQPGSYLPTATLLTGTACNIFLKGADTIKVDFINAGFSPAASADCGNTTISFKDTSTSFFKITTYAWSFGDGGKSSLKNPTYNYAVSNNYPVSLIVTTELGCSDTASISLPIVLKNVPVASIFNDSAACASKRISYSSSVVSQDAVATYRWSFSNGVTAAGASTNNVYATSGNYRATLIVSTVNGCADTVTSAITINPTPMVQASNDRTICLGETVQLSATGALSYSWGPAAGLSCFNCANPVATPVKSVKYSVVGDNSFGCVSIDTVLITVSQPFDIHTTMADTICTGQLSQLSVSGADKYSWSPALGLSNANIANPIATPDITTRYRVIGSDKDNCFADTAYVTVAVGKYPTVSLGIDKVLAAGTQLTFNPQVTGGPMRSWDWYPKKDLSCYNCATPTANIKQDIIYAVKATNELGCSATDTVSIKVFCESTQVYIPNMFTPDNDGMNDILMVRGSGINIIKTFRIFNRWGEVVFEKAGFAANDKAYGWDGTVRGMKAPTDIYVYTCEVVCENGNSYVYKGNVAIIK